eukprot:1013633_1
MSREFFKKQLDEEIWKDCDGFNAKEHNINDLSNDDVLKHEYNRLIDTNHCLAEQYRSCKQANDKLTKENESLRRSLKECEILLQNRLERENDTWNEMEVIHFELKERFKTSQIELKRYQSLTNQQNKQIEDLQKHITQCNTTQQQHLLVEDAELYDRVKLPQNIDTTERLSGCLDSTLKVLHSQLSECLSPSMFLLWKKWIFALMQHFENKLNSYKLQNNESTDCNQPANISLAYNEPRVIVKYKNKKRNKKDSKAHKLSRRRSTSSHQSHKKRVLSTHKCQNRRNSN